MANPPVLNPFIGGETCITDRITKVTDAFSKAVNYFNNQDWDKYTDLLDDNVVVFNVDHVKFVCGKKNVKDYLHKIKNSETFYPTSDFTLFPAVYPMSIRGVALWTHTEHGHVNVPIKYEVQFEPGSEAKLTSVWAAHSR